MIQKPVLFIGTLALWLAAAALASVGEAADRSATELVAAKLLRLRDELGLDGAQVRKLEFLLERWQSTERALSQRLPRDEQVSWQSRGDALLVWQTLGRERVLVDRDALFILTPEQRAKWRNQRPR